MHHFAQEFEITIKACNAILNSTLKKLQEINQKPVEEIDTKEVKCCADIVKNMTNLLLKIEKSENGELKAETKAKSHKSSEQKSVPQSVNSDETLNLEIIKNMEKFEKILNTLPSLPLHMQNRATRRKNRQKKK